MIFFATSTPFIFSSKSWTTITTAIINWTICEIKLSVKTKALIISKAIPTQWTSLIRRKRELIKTPDKNVCALYHENSVNKN